MNLKKSNRKNALVYLTLFILIFTLPLIAAGCSKERPPSVMTTGVTEEATPTPPTDEKPSKTQNGTMKWDAEFTPPPCDINKNIPLIDEALALSGLNKEEFGFSKLDFSESTYSTNGYLSDDFLLSWFMETRKNPARAGCFEKDTAKALDYYLSQPHPVAGMIRHAANLLDRKNDAGLAFDPDNLPGDFDEALAVLCATLKNNCKEAKGELPKELKKALAPLMWAIIEGIEARKQVNSEIENKHDSDWWNLNGGNFILPDTRKAGAPDLTDHSDYSYLLGKEGRSRLYLAAAQIAHAIEHADWSGFVGMKGVEYKMQTPAGWIIVKDGAQHRYEDEDKDVLLLLDLGGDDLYLNRTASNTSGTNSVSIAIDLAGNDIYVYQTYKTAYDNESLLPSDSSGRYKGDSQTGNISLSDASRQGAARNGIAMLFDFGGGRDHYQSLRASQGYAHLGVGVLFDEGGADKYLSEDSSQGSAQFGIALLIDAGPKDDIYSSFTRSQGFGYAGGAGFLLNEGGGDTYVCNHGDPKYGGLALYYTPQRAGKGNNSFCQGAGLGKRGNDKSLISFLSGGIGILRDISGNDTYEASIFAQGTGYWQGTGILSDGEGSDTYDAYYYTQGGAAHFAVAIFADSGEGNDLFNQKRPPINVHMGAGHDYSIGVFINESGNNKYAAGSLSLGASNCNGVGLFVDNNGDDYYKASSDYGSGMGNVSGKCKDTRPNAKSIGIMIDAGGEDTYEYPEDSEFPVPTDGGTWGHKRHGLDSEYGAGIDREAETGIHSESDP